ncbi:MAG: tyrosine-type recombinase/integrase, partial [Candidatus Bathyarchaeia archaeon]
EHISFHTLRHFKATMEFQRTHNILHVMQMLGHKNINNTMIYMHLVNFESDDYHVNTAKTVEGACELVKAGFEYVTEMDSTRIFRKRK